MKETGVTELSLDSPEFKVTVKRAPGQGPALSSPAEAQTAAPHTAAASYGTAERALVPVTAAVVGIFTLGGGQSSAAVSPGDWVVAGQTLGTIEAMNIVNEVRCPLTGRLAEILVEDGAPVEYGQTLFVIEEGEGGGREQIAS